MMDVVQEVSHDSTKDETINNIRRGFRQLQMEYLLDLPSAETVANHSAIDIWTAPASTIIVGF